MHIRICRHCRAGLSLDATVCAACQKQTMPPARFKAVLLIMATLLLIASSAVVYGAYLYYDASKALYCSAQHSQIRIESADGGFACELQCEQACQQRGAQTGEALLYGRSFCDCSCGGCFQ